MADFFSVTFSSLEDASFFAVLAFVVADFLLTFLSVAFSADLADFFTLSSVVFAVLAADFLRSFSVDFCVAAGGDPRDSATEIDRRPNRR